MNEFEALNQFREQPKMMTEAEALANLLKPCGNACVKPVLDLNTGVTDTSIDAFKGIQKEMGTRQIAVLNTFKELKTATNLEVSKRMGLPINQVTPRTNELVKMGKVEACGKRKCQISGKFVKVWWPKPSNKNLLPPLVK